MSHKPKRTIAIVRARLADHADLRNTAERFAAQFVISESIEAWVVRQLARAKVEVESLGAAFKGNRRQHFVLLDPSPGREGYVKPFLVQGPLLALQCAVPLHGVYGSVFIEAPRIGDEPHTVTVVGFGFLTTLL